MSVALLNRQRALSALAYFKAIVYHISRLDNKWIRPEILCTL